MPPTHTPHPRNLPELPGPRASDRTVHNYLRLMAAYLGDAANHSHHHLETLMATVLELQQKLDALTAADAENAAATSAEIAQLAAAVAAIVPGEPVTQAQLDQVQAVIDGMTARNASLTADDAPAA